MKPKLPRLFSYVVDHDTGYAPNPCCGSCILSHCKFSKSPPRKNLIESANEGDWIVGTGGTSPKTVPHGKIVFVMKVEGKLPIGRLFTDELFALKRGRYDPPSSGTLHCKHGQWFLVATKEFWYYGRKAIDIPDKFRAFKEPDGRVQSLEKKGPKYKCNFSPQFTQQFISWIKTRKAGCHGKPVMFEEQEIKCSPSKRLCR